MPPDRRAHGPTVRAFRHARDLTLQQLADRTDSHKGHVGHIETGSYRASVAHTAALAGALGVPTEALTGQIPPIRDLSAILGVARNDLAHAAGISTERMARIERGTERPHADELDAIARRLGVDVAALGGDPVEAVGA